MICEVGYDVGDGIYSVNMIEGNETLIKLASKDHAKRYGYTVAYISKPLTEYEVAERRKRGMPIVDSFDSFFLEKD